jgi:uncharacterized protein (TIGR02001 family)
MKKTVIAASLAALLPLSIPAVKAAEPTPEIEISGNVSLVSDYRFRGISQTDKKPAIQGGFDLSHKSGLYLGTWASNVSQWANPGGSMEIDFYGGYATELPMGIGLDIGHIWYQYPGNNAASIDSDTSNRSREWYVGISYGLLSYQFSKTTTTWFGVPESKGSYYHSLGLEYSPIDKVTLSATAGFQKIKGLGGGNDLSFKDYSLGGSYDLGDGYSFGLTYHKVSFKDAASKANDGWFGTDFTSNRAIYKSSVVASLTKEF